MKKIVVNKYFLDAKLALKEAKKKNKTFREDSARDDLIQICYYDGKKLKNAPKNCINVPFSKLTDYFATTKNIYAFNIDFTNSKYITSQERENFNLLYLNKFRKAFKLKSKYQDNLVEKIKHLKPDFSEKILRVFIANDFHSTYYPHIVQRGLKRLKKKYKVYEYKCNKIQTCHKLPLYKQLYKVNPHIVINTNNTIDSSILNESVKKIIIIQDFISMLSDNNISMRENDIVYSLHSYFDKFLDSQKIKYKRASWNIDKRYFNNFFTTNKKKDKIIFIGNSSNLKVLYLYGKSGILQEVINYFIAYGTFTEEFIKKISIKFKIPINVIVNLILPYVIQDISLLSLCSLNISLDIEVYGKGWEAYDNIMQYYKGNIKGKKDMANIFKSTKYIFIPSFHIINEYSLTALLTNTIPVVYDNRTLTNNDKSYEKYMIFYKKIEMIESIIKNLQYNILDINKNKLQKKYNKELK